ncbi:Copper amine oxidase [Echinococcus multilocularis]|uniref:Copper amine oxidase n=1 Tax=Echinococcus multilocularis TaxID=6211 RepID=A0A068YDC9_ECHMU|nr:Copper amine oxidase [Echinococcus multilocularis]
MQAILHRYKRALARKTAKLNQNVEDLVIQPEDALSHGNPFRSPFDPRSEEDLVSSTYGGSESGPTLSSGRHRRRGWLEDGSGTELLFDGFELSAEHREGKETNSRNAYNVEPLPAPRHSRWKAKWANGESPRVVPSMHALEEEVEEREDDDDDDDSWVDEESRLRPPALPINFEAALAGLPTEDPATRTRRLRPLQYPLYVNVAGGQDGIGGDIYERTKSYGDTRPLRTMDQNISEEELPDTLLIRTRRRTMSGVTGFLPRSSTLSSSSIWFGDHPIPTKTQIYAAEQSPLRLSSIQLQAQAEIARRRSRNNLAARSLISIGNGGGGGTRRSRSLERLRALGPSASALYGPTGRRMHGGAPIVERAIKRHASKRDGYETLSLVHVPRLEEQPSSIITGTAAEQRKLRRPASSASMARYWTSKGTSQMNGVRNRDEARSLIAQAAVDLAVHTYDASEPLTSTGLYFFYFFTPDCSLGLDNSTYILW